MPESVIRTLKEIKENKPIFSSQEASQTGRFLLHKNRKKYSSTMITMFFPDSNGPARPAEAGKQRCAAVGRRRGALLTETELWRQKAQSGRKMQTDMRNP